MIKMFPQYQIVLLLQAKTKQNFQRSKQINKKLRYILRTINERRRNFLLGV